MQSNCSSTENHVNNEIKACFVLYTLLITNVQRCIFQNIPNDKRIKCTNIRINKANFTV